MPMDVIGQWQEKTLRLSSKLTSATLENVVLETIDFPAKNCVVDASELVKVDSAGVGFWFGCEQWQMQWMWL